MLTLSNYDDPDLSDNFKRVMRYLEEANKSKYATPNSLFIRRSKDTPDVLGTFSDEVVALREIAMDAYSLYLDTIDKNACSDGPDVDKKRILKIREFVTEQPWFNHPAKSKR